MKSIFFILFILIGCFINAQQQINRFSEGEKQEIVSTTKDGAPAGPGTGNGDGDLEDDDLPIDDYIPLLVVMGLGIIIYSSYNKTHKI